MLNVDNIETQETNKVICREEILKPTKQPH